ncbi:MAG: sugar phosphate isomerase/epimerase [Chloroflexota bacterium]|nr:sugar phosphate isomerase/epimerase [Chloroflexota bacterium]
MPQLAVITDEISTDLAHALEVCDELGLSAVELRVVGAASITSLPDDEIDGIARLLRDRGKSVAAIASPFLKCNYWGDDEQQHQDQLAILRRSIAIAMEVGAPIVRAFNFWRQDDPTQLYDVALAALDEATAICRDSGVLLGLENEHACTAATGEEAAWFLDRIPDTTLGLIWDPGNEAVVGSNPFPNGYDHIRTRIHHVHLKDAAIGHDPTFVVMGQGEIDYVGQFRALAESDYRGAISLETHIGLSQAEKEAASRACIPAIRSMAEQAGLALT